MTAVRALGEGAAGDWVSYAQNPQTPPPSKLEKLKDDFYVILGEGGNTTVLLTNEGVVFVDDKFERNYDDIVAKVKSLTDKPVGTSSTRMRTAITPSAMRSFCRPLKSLVTPTLALHKKSWAVIDRPYSLGCATVGALYERPRCIFCAKPSDLRAAMVKSRQPGPPQLTFTDRMSINLGGVGSDGPRDASLS